MNEAFVGNVDGKHGWFEDRILEPILIFAQPLNGVSSISMPSTQALQLLYVDVVELPQPSER